MVYDGYNIVVCCVIVRDAQSGENQPRPCGSVCEKGIGRTREIDLNVCDRTVM